MDTSTRATSFSASATPATPATDAGRRPLLAVVGGLAAFGVALLAAPGPTTRLFAWIAYGSADRLHAFGPEALAYLQLTHAILGALLLGWALTLAAIVRRWWPLAPRAAWWAVAAPALAWYATDTAYSLVSGFWRNAVFNSAFALALAVPLAIAWRGFARGAARGTGAGEGTR